MGKVKFVRCLIPQLVYLNIPELLRYGVGGLPSVPDDPRQPLRLDGSRELLIKMWDSKEVAHCNIPGTPNHGILHPLNAFNCRTRKSMWWLSALDLWE